jgi:hypothetical protein
MTTQPVQALQTVPLHPVLGAVAAAQDAMKAVRDVQPVFMIAAEKETAVTELARLEAMAAELKLRVVASASDAADEAGARDNGAWLASVTRTDFPAGRAQGRLAQALDRRWTRVAAGMADGLVSPTQATVVVDVLNDLPDHLDPELAAQAETEMVRLCGQFRPCELRRLGRHLLELVAPEIAEAEEAKRLQDEEQRAREKTSLRSRLIGDGLARTTIVHPVLDRDRLLTYLESYTSPRKQPEALSGEQDRIPHHDSSAKPSAPSSNTLTSAAPAASTARRSAKPCDCATNTAAPKTAPHRQPGAKPTTSTLDPRRQHEPRRGHPRLQLAPPPPPRPTLRPRAHPQRRPQVPPPQIGPDDGTLTSLVAQKWP